LLEAEECHRLEIVPRLAYMGFGSFGRSSDKSSARSSFIDAVGFSKVPHMPNSEINNTPKNRYTELDAIRGIAALTVVFYHFRIMWFFPMELTGRSKLLMYALTPLTLGHEAVLLFFVISGFVLSVPYLRDKGGPYPVYLVRRILRIYGPYVFALGLAVGGAALWHEPLGGNFWRDLTWSRPLSGRLVLQHLLFIGNYDWSQYNTAFWSLVLEMRISIVFPLLFMIANALRTGRALLLACFLSVGASLVTHWRPGLEHTMETVHVGAIFILGILLAKNVEAVSAWYGRLSNLRRLLLVTFSFILYTWGHHVRFVIRNGWGVQTWVITIGAIGYIVIGLNSKVARDVLNSRIPRFLGRTSYSLYLVHGTVLFALAHVLGGKLSPLAQLPIYLICTIVLAVVFCIAIEEPFVRLSRRVSRWSYDRHALSLPGPEMQPNRESVS
jgi:peptidoglycan/LPS O-acetylase OafA/YrhL